MTPFTQHTGIAVRLLIDNVDTDQIIPSYEMKTTGQSGLSDGLFAGWRYLDPAKRVPDPAFALNAPANQGATILIAGENFGCGSSREHAVWALAEFGIRCVVAVSFGEIFHGNCLRNSILPISLPREAITKLTATDAEPLRLSVDLPHQEISGEGADAFGFEIDPYGKRLLLEGLDPIGLTLKERPAIDAFHAADKARRSWVYR